MPCGALRLALSAHDLGSPMLTLLFAALALAASDAPVLQVYDELPSTLLPLYPESAVDLRASATMGPNLFYRGAIT